MQGRLNFNFKNFQGQETRRQVEAILPNLASFKSRFQDVTLQLNCMKPEATLTEKYPKKAAQWERSELPYLVSVVRTRIYVLSGIYRLIMNFDGHTASFYQITVRHTAANELDTPRHAYRRGESVCVYWTGARVRWARFRVRWAQIRAKWARIGVECVHIRVRQPGIRVQRSGSSSNAIAQWYGCFIDKEGNAAHGLGRSIRASEVMASLEIWGVQADICWLDSNGYSCGRWQYSKQVALYIIVFGCWKLTELMVRFDTRHLKLHTLIECYPLGILVIGRT